MSERRMFSKSITESDAFLDLEFSAQALYLHMSMNADDEGFINNPRSVLRISNTKESDLQALLDNGYLIKFESGVYAIKHWKVNNRIRKDRARGTNHTEEKALLIEKKSGEYALRENGEAPTVPEKEPEEPKASEDDEIGNVAEDDFYEDDDSQDEDEAEVIEREKERVYDSMSQPRKDYAETVFDILLTNNLPRPDSLITFTMRDFRIALESINALHLHSEEVIQATKNYAEVVKLKRQGKSWWNNEQPFHNFCSSNTILRFLPGTYKVEDYLINKSGKQKNPLEDKITL